MVHMPEAPLTNLELAVQALWELDWGDNVQPSDHQRALAILNTLSVNGRLKP